MLSSTDRHSRVPGGRAPSPRDDTESPLQEARGSESLPQTYPAGDSELGNSGQRWRVVGAIVLGAFSTPSFAIVVIGAALPVVAVAAEPAPGSAAAMAAVLDSKSDGGPTLRDRLRTLEMRDCLTADQQGIVAGLDALRAVHAVALEHSRHPRVWARWERALVDVSPDAWLLVWTWLDAPEAARRQFLCDDGLPPSWKRLDPDAFVLEAILWFDVGVAERDHALRAGVPADREAAVVQLMELRRALLTRFDATYPPSDDVARARLADRLSLMWREMVEPWHWGFTPRGRLAEGVAKPDELLAHRPRALPLGGEIPDPDDVAARDRVVAGWRKQRRVLDAEILRLRQELDAVRAAAEQAEGKALDDAVRQAVRLDQELGSLREDVVGLQQRVANYSTGRPWIDRMLRNGFKRGAVRKLEIRQGALEYARDQAGEAVAVAVSRGAIEPYTARPEDGGTTGGDVVAGRPGPGNWLAGLPGAADRAHHTTEPAVGIPEGTGLVERRYEGPLPLPSGAWSDDLVRALRSRHPELDDQDARILLGLVRLAYRELPDRTAVEEAVWRSLRDAEGLRLRGEERTLSEIWLPGRGQNEQPVVTFVLTLRF